MPDLTYDTTLAAASFSSVAGIIAGFAFGVLVWAFERVGDKDGQPSTHEDNIRALTLLGIAFLGNVLAAFLFARLAGQTDANAPRTGVLSFLAGSVFGLLTVLTVEALVFIVGTAGNAWLTALFRRIFGFSVLVNLLFQLSTTVGLIRSQPGTEPMLQSSPFPLIGITAMGLLIIAAAWWVSTRENHQRFRLNSRKGFDALIWGIMLFTLLVAVLSGVFGSFSLDSELPFWAIAAIRLAWMILVAWAIVFLPVRRDRRGVDQAAG